MWDLNKRRRRPGNRFGKSAPGRPRGFTLIETIVAMAVAAIALTAIFKLHLQSLSIAQTASFYSAAPLLAGGKLCEWRLKPLDELTDSSGSFGDDFSGYQWSVEIEDATGEMLENLPEDLAKNSQALKALAKLLEGFKKIDIRVSGPGKSVYRTRAYLFWDEKDDQK
jgi:general secretion pathway protein I